jgi:hypothetical protein
MTFSCRDCRAGWIYSNVGVVLGSNPPLPPSPEAEREETPSSVPKEHYIWFVNWFTDLSVAEILNGYTCFMTEILDFKKYYLQAIISAILIHNLLLKNIVLCISRKSNDNLIHYKRCLFLACIFCLTK